MSQWRNRVFKRLRGAMAPRVVELGDLSALIAEEVEATGRVINSRTVSRFAKESVEMGLFQPVRSGLWINKMAVPSPSMAEAASRIRGDAVVSLHTVLGDAGVLNNYTSQVYAILPNRGDGNNPATGTLEAGGTLFHFRSLPIEILNGGDKSDRLVSMVPYARATAEAAAVHWFYLAKSNRSSILYPDTQCDVSSLDEDRLDRLSSLAGVRDRVFQWLDACRQREHDDDNHVGWTIG